MYECLSKRLFSCYGSITRATLKQKRHESLQSYHVTNNEIVGGAMASWLVCSAPDRVVRVRVLVGDIVLCSWARHFTLVVPLSTQVHKWVPAKMLGVTLRWTSIPSRGEEKYSKSLHATETGDKCRPVGPSRLLADFNNEINHSTDEDIVITTKYFCLNVESKCFGSSYETGVCSLMMIINGPFTPQMP